MIAVMESRSATPWRQAACSHVAILSYRSTGRFPRSTHYTPRAGTKCARRQSSVSLSIGFTPRSRNPTRAPNRNRARRRCCESARKERRANRNIEADAIRFSAFGQASKKVARFW